MAYIQMAEQAELAAPVAMEPTAVVLVVPAAGLWAAAVLTVAPVVPAVPVVEPGVAATVAYIPSRQMRLEFRLPLNLTVA